MEEGEKSVRPSVNARMKPEQTLFVAGPLLISLVIIAIGAAAGLGFLLAIGFAAMAASAIWCIAAGVMIMRNRKKRFHRGFDERTSFGDFMKGK